MTALLTVRNLTAGYGRARILDGLDLDVAEREIVTVIGPNGAGKTTLLSAIMGLLPRRGEVHRADARIRPGEVEAMVRARVALVPEHRALFTEMSVADNLLLGRYPSHLRGEKLASADFDTIYALFPRLAERRRQLAGTLSGGERQMLALARGLMGRPRLLMLDEPSLGLAPRIVADVLRTIASLPAQGVSVLIVEQNARAVLQIADRGYVLELGAITLAGSAQALAAEPRIIDSYLGRGR